MGPLVQFEQLGNGIGKITLFRPDAANALSLALLDELSKTLNKIKAEQNMRVIILTGAGEKAFCSGADLKERKEMNDQEVKIAVSAIGNVINQIEAFPQPVIAAINGVAFGGGLEMALACDLRIASNHIKLGLTETSLGIIPGAGGTQRLPRLIGIGKAKELIYTARKISAEEAYKLGIVEHIVSKEKLMEKAMQLAEEMAQNAPLALVQAKSAINTGLETDLITGLKIEQLAYHALISTEDRQEGLRAFQEKRRPVYHGK